MNPLFVARRTRALRDAVDTAEPQSGRDRSNPNATNQEVREGITLISRQLGRMQRPESTKGQQMIGVYLQLGAMTEAQYHAVDDAVQAADVSEAGCMLHTCFKEGENLAVFDVWETKEAYEAFAAQLGPIAAGLGMTEMPNTMYVDMVAYDPR